MQKSKSLDHFTSRPKSSFVLAVLMVLLGFIAISGLVPTSANRTYFAGHDWLLAAICWLMATFFSYCGIKGWRQHMTSNKIAPGR